MEITVGDADENGNRLVYLDGVTKGHAYFENGQWHVLFGFASMTVDDLSHLQSQFDIWKKGML